MAENTPGLDQSMAQLDQSLLREIWKPVAAGVLSIGSFLVGSYLDTSHQPHADQLSAQIDTIRGDLSATDNDKIRTFLESGDLPKNADPQLVKTAKTIDSLNDERVLENSAGSGFNLLGSIALIYSGLKTMGLVAGRSALRDKLRSKHPDLAPQRVHDNVDTLITFGDTVEYDDKLREKHGFGPNKFVSYSRSQLQEVGRDIETSEKIMFSEESLRESLTEMLNEAQWNTFRGSDSDERTAEIKKIEAFKIRLVDDLWVEKEGTFRSLKSWYDFRRKQAVHTDGFQRINDDELFLPEIDLREGGIGIALGRITQYIRTSKEYLDDPIKAGEALIYATTGAAFLDAVAPREDGGYWFDYADDLEKNAASANNHSVTM
ncbi:MAG: hypothetical protein NTX11_00020 [Candidatus Saccharibacteria bacterium]|nr:hypothetical protein [Candidatus Saccharibacteria bacterium]